MDLAPVSKAVDNTIEFGNRTKSFKYQSKNLLLNHVPLLDSKFDIIENTHYYNDTLKKITKNIHYISYPDELNELVANRYYEEKVLKCSGTYNRTLDTIAQTLNIPKDKITHKLLLAYLIKSWKEQLKNFSLSDMQPYLINNLFDLNCLLNSIQSITKQQVCNEEQISKIWHHWYNKNKSYILQLQ